MGVSQLWAELKEYRDAYRILSGKARSTSASGDGDDNARIVSEVCGKVLAIDTSVWIFQGSSQSELREVIFDEHARVLMIVFNRIMNLLRYGVTPVFVLEGETPEAKMGRLQQRSLARGLGGAPVGNRRGGRHDVLGRKVVELLDLLGIPHVAAPGEAEAMCAALTRAGLADGVVTTDVDALMFGATRVYRECRLQMDIPRNNCVEWMDSDEAARRCFGITGGGGCAAALQAVGCLSGCDYSVSGGRGVGVKTAMDAVQQLTKGRQDDAQVLPELLRYLEAGPDSAITALTKCTGCKTCGHEKHGRQPCPQCGPGPCRPRAQGAGCQCEFHRTEPQRKFMRVISRATTTGPSFTSEFQSAIATFEDESQRALEAAQELKDTGGRFSWSRRPDVSGVFSLMHPLLGHSGSDPQKLIWTYGEVRAKMRGVLMEWDIRQGPQPSAPVAAVVEFRPRRIKQVAAKDGGAWAYIIEFDRIPTVNSADVDFDVEQLASSKHVKSRHVRQTVIHRLWSHLLTQREEEEQFKLAKPKRGRTKAATTATTTTTTTAVTAGTGTGTVAPGHDTLDSPTGGGRARSKAAPSGAARRAAAGTAAPIAFPSSSLGVATSSLGGAAGGSSQLMARWLAGGGGAAAAAAAAGGPSTSAQQQLPSGAPRRTATAPVAACGGRGGAAAVDLRSDDPDDLEEEEEDDMDFQMTQRNDGVAAGGGGGSGGRSGAGGAAGGGAATGLCNGPLPTQYQPLWGDGDDEEEGSEGGSGDDWRRAGQAEGGGSFNVDLDTVVPSSLDELLAGAGPFRVTQKRADAGTTTAAVAVAEAGPSAGGPSGPEAGHGGAAAAAPLPERPFRPHPTGPGPGQQERARGQGDAAVPGGPRMAVAAVGSGRVEVEVMDLTDSPAAAVPAAAATTVGRTAGPPAGRLYGRTSVRATTTAAGDWEAGEPEAVGSAVKPSGARGPGSSWEGGRDGCGAAAVADHGGNGGGGVPSSSPVRRGILFADEEEEGEEEEQQQQQLEEDRERGDEGMGAEEEPGTGPSGGPPGGTPGRLSLHEAVGEGAEDNQRLNQRLEIVGPSAPAVAQHNGVPGGSGAAGELSPAARRMRLLQALFPDRPPPSPATPAQPPKKKGREGGAAGPPGLAATAPAAAPQAPPAGRGGSDGSHTGGDGGSIQAVAQEQPQQAQQPANAEVPGRPPPSSLRGPGLGQVPGQVVSQGHSQREGRAADEVLGSPSKRQHRGEASGGCEGPAGGPPGLLRSSSGGGAGEAAVRQETQGAAPSLLLSQIPVAAAPLPQLPRGFGGATVMGAAGAAPAVVAVDLTLDDDDDEEEVEGEETGGGSHVASEPRTQLHRPASQTGVEAAGGAAEGGAGPSARRCCDFGAAGRGADSSGDAGAVAGVEVVDLT